MIANLKGLKVYYEAIGKGEPILLLHGWGTGTDHMRPIIKMILEKGGARVYALDFPGFGFSERPREAWDVGQYAECILSFLELHGLEAANILGHSFGGRVAIKLASQFPGRVKKLVLVDSAGIRPDRTFQYHFKVALVKMARKVERILPDGSLGSLISEWISRQGSRDYRQAGEMQATFVKVVNEDLRICLPAIQSSTLIIWGELDQETPVRDAYLMNGLIPNSHLEIIKGTGHFPFIENYQAFQNILIPFLGDAH